MLKREDRAKHVLHILDRINGSIAVASDRRDEGFKVLRQTMGYCWSVATAVLPETGKSLMEKWVATKDPDVRRIMEDNHSKNRLTKMDAAWEKRWRREVN